MLDLVDRTKPFRSMYPEFTDHVGVTSHDGQIKTERRQNVDLFVRRQLPKTQRDVRVLHLFSSPFVAVAKSNSARPSGRYILMCPGE